MTTRKRSRREHREHDALRREMRQLRRELIHLLAVLVPDPPEGEPFMFVTEAQLVRAVQAGRMAVARPT